MLRDLGCDHLQGYAFARPMSPQDFLNYARKREWFETFAQATGERLKIA